MKNAADMELIAHCFQHMLNKTDAQTLFEKYNLLWPSGNPSYQKIADAYTAAPGSITLSEVQKYCYAQWSNQYKSDKNNMLANALKSGKLTGHDWCGARPSTLHLSFQTKVRECIDGDITLDEYLAKGLAIAKHEFYMVAVHDLCESTIISSFPEDVIPPTQSKSITDFVFKKLPMDLKISNYPSEWQAKAGRLSPEEQKQLAVELYINADTDRMRKQAEKTPHNWGLNRMYIMVADTDKWLSHPDAMLNDLVKKLQTAQPFTADVNGFDIAMYLIEI